MAIRAAFIPQTQRGQDPGARVTDDEFLWICSRSCIGGARNTFDAYRSCANGNGEKFSVPHDPRARNPNQAVIVAVNSLALGVGIIPPICFAQVFVVADINAALGGDEAT